MLHGVRHSAEKRAAFGRALTAGGQLDLARRRRQPGGFRLTPRDREIVRWIGRLRIATAAQGADRFKLGRVVSYARLRGLVRLGLLEHARILHGAPGVYLATRAGLASVDLDLPPARVDLRTYRHDLELSSLVVDLEREFGHERISTEREMRATDTPLGAAPARPLRFAVPLAGAGGQLQLTPARHPRLHFPDCAVAGEADGLLAVELERSAKGRARLRRILIGYVGARHIRAVRYYALGDRVRELVASETAGHRRGRSAATSVIEQQQFGHGPSSGWENETEHAPIASAPSVKQQRARTEATSPHCRRSSKAAITR